MNNIHVYVCIFVIFWLCTGIFMHMSTYICEYTVVNTCITYMCMHLCTYVCMLAIYACVFYLKWICTCTSIYKLYIYIHVHLNVWETVTINISFIMLWISMSASVNEMSSPIMKKAHQHSNMYWIAHVCLNEEQ